MQGRKHARLGAGMPLWANQVLAPGHLQIPVPSNPGVCELGKDDPGLRCLSGGSSRPLQAPCWVSSSRSGDFPLPRGSRCCRTCLVPVCA